jgi:hypothetical protein
MQVDKIEYACAIMSSMFSGVVLGLSFASLFFRQK